MILALVTGFLSLVQNNQEQDASNQELVSSIQSIHFANYPPG